MDIQNLKAQSAPDKMRPKTPTPRHIVVEMAKVKDKETVLKETSDK